MTTTLSGDNPLTRIEYESIGYAAYTAMRRAERAVRNWPYTGYHQVYTESWDLINKSIDELEFFCPSPAHIQLYKDWRLYHRTTQELHVRAIQNRPKTHLSAFQDHLALARQRRVNIGTRLADVKAAELRERTSEDSTIRTFQHRLMQSDAMSEHWDRVTALQRNAAAARETAFSVPAPAITASVNIFPFNAPTHAPATSLVPISIQAFSDILEAGIFGTVDSSRTTSGSSRTIDGDSRSAYRSPTAEDAEDSGDE
ncbi:hypothetical protein EG328_002965 [Venturia inaequalis]|uniref:Uncharacterized protein n=1 Tax=Venturia inaequalis TaxID=5025 RepID=A0A8H3UU90_VENIN|nr:hypothetical protein EG328_002965 [Venturia inaequalis]KAE9994105.1 hypothetical protein EG327_001177 [Venturia inaequalis]RDI82554.1 hypothetical protein Vi05172_g7344 [Venturia inaequalis]